MAKRKSQRVLLVEDEYLVAIEAEDLLAELGHKVVAAASTLSSAIHLAQTERVDCAILDVNLGGVLSFPVAEKLAERNIPFIFATAYPPYTLAEEYSRVPRLQKPLDRRSLGTAIEEATSAR